MASLVAVVAILDVDLVVLLGPLPQAVGRGEDEHRNVDPMIDPPVSETLAPCLGWEKSNHQG